MLKKHDLLNLDWTKTNGMIPAIIQDYFSHEILMHGYMNEEALLKTQKDGLVTFYSRTKNRLWTKGETSGNYLNVISIRTDCDHDALLILVKSTGVTCHLNNTSCFFSKKYNVNFLFELENLIENRKNKFSKNSYTSSLYQSGTSRIAQKVGEEAVETILAAMKKDQTELINESSDLIYHLIVLLHDQNLNLNLVLDNLKKRR
ncbi:bifunctional phosphoribosyl-AMP cyclohydrolase/phosphoribosyl-ATP pyrophosphatase protein [Buchnera aphidicola str. Ak (Acyrthosiphon kondoi)]|uniref:Histidine biosynthesis bifunctional protein HisIE n=1 Tax=Buchnera aphidicola str. Ak (Acyrthosiphon kondoi) TaxID=1005090 RepID=G2LMI1_9GAMM|nr:bifunctional phosphoribosyl-AMP cyclohydrolase/phosphoribosyl-ATP diphosphatase HisIE [Buchnera aphidicola]AEO08469.1 bifunctional phosphoribosyl-AMP cyclohydrolase/phosphoribosyl-ATP pyrophosphatase protein [Buchnera aphidicola str. Ak (Acyrthosiphon kondoi)]WAI18175.1 MAG: bifunctional phosphoribosyl-AMP cyclohydrolase/phosphoribosyl-ATP diphosphatase HisIE [Buchnera aphidicola (Acyrthosiphon caraganae)]